VLTRSYRNVIAFSQRAPLAIPILQGLSKFQGQAASVARIHLLQLGVLSVSSRTFRRL
jgi:hypothetical protein